MKNQIAPIERNFVQVQLGVLIFQEENSFIAYCPALQMSAYGESVSDAKEAFEDLIKSYIEDTEKMGTLEEDLKKHGWQKNTIKRIVEPPEEFDLNIPAGMLRKQFNKHINVPVHN